MIKKRRPILTATFTFHNVGQGLFYTGKFGDFSFVYDCGSTRRSHLNSIVARYKNNLTTPRLDLLILSHLHDDHVAGLNTLLKKPKVSVDTVVLPYLSPIERLMVSLAKTSLPSWFYEFWADPVQFLIARGVKRILLLGGGKASPPKDDFRPEGRFENEGERLDISEMPDDDHLQKEVITKDEQWRRFLDQGRLLTKSHDGYAYKRVPRGMWVFRFFNCRAKDSKLNRFERCIGPITRGVGLTNIIKNMSKLQHLKKCYNLLQGEFNNTSIVVYHSPIMHERGKVYRRNAIGHLLTGDISLNQKWTEIERHFRGVFSKLSLCLVPHHGAKGNWNKAVLAKVPQKCQWIISSGISNKHHHPSYKVIRDIIQNRNPLCLSNELTRFSTIIGL